MIEKYITYTLRESGCRWLRCLKWYLASLQSMLQIEINQKLVNLFIYIARKVLNFPVQESNIFSLGQMIS